MKKYIFGVLFLLAFFFVIYGLSYWLLSWGEVDPNIIPETAIVMAGFPTLFPLIIVLAWWGF